MRRLVFAVLCVISAAACSGDSSTGPAEVDYQIALDDAHEFYDTASGEYLEELVFSVHAGDTLVQNAEMYFQVSTGVIEAADPTSDAGGLAAVTWALSSPERNGSPAPELGVCANNLIGSTCDSVYTFTLNTGAGTGGGGGATSRERWLGPTRRR